MGLDWTDQQPAKNFTLFFIFIYYYFKKIIILNILTKREEKLRVVET
jgi:F0F1-type ATP synthase membrane subunit b/b'